jgi:hypothetical protein
LSVAFTNYTPACAVYLPGAADFKITDGLASSFTKTLVQGNHGVYPDYTPVAAADSPCTWWAELTGVTFGFWLTPNVCDTDPYDYTLGPATAWLVVTRDANGYTVEILYDNSDPTPVLYASWYISSTTTPCTATASGGSAPAISIDPQ